MHRALYAPVLVRACTCMLPRPKSLGGLDARSPPLNAQRINAAARSLQLTLAALNTSGLPSSLTMLFSELPFKTFRC
jgi:hypothetical protein